MQDYSLDKTSGLAYIGGMEDEMAKVEQVREGRETEPYRDGFEIERDTLTDGSVAFNVVHRLEAGPGVVAGYTLIRFACINEKAAGELADVLADNTSWIEVE